MGNVADPAAGPRSCGDCAAKPGDPHSDGCDVARCLVTGIQRLQCTGRHDCGSQVWSGAWPGDAECEEFDWWAEESEATKQWFRQNGWPVSDQPHHDLNRLHMETDWDPAARRRRKFRAPVDDTFYVRWHLERGLALQPAVYTMDGVTVRYPEEWMP